MNPSDVPYWQYIERYLMQCCHTIRKPCISVGLLRIVADVTAMVIRDHISRGQQVDVEQVRSQILTSIRMLRNMGAANIVDNAVVNFNDGVVSCQQQAVAVNSGGGKRIEKKRSTLLDFLH